MVDENRSTAQLRPDIQISDLVWRGSEQLHFVRGGRDGAIIFVSAEDVVLMRQLDGKQGSERETEPGPDDARLDILLRRMRASDLLLTSSPRPMGQSSVPSPHWGVILRGDGRLMRNIVRLPEGVRTTLLRLTSILGVAGVLASMSLLVPLGRSGRDVFQTPALLLVVALVVWVSFLPHELAHATAAINVGARVAGFGLMWRPPIVVPYCIVRDGIFVHGRTRRASISLAGPLANLSIALPLVVVWTLLPPSQFRGTVALAVIGITLASIAALVPARGLDGLSALNHLSGSVDLLHDFRTYHSSGEAGQAHGFSAVRIRWLRLYAILYMSITLTLIATASIAGWALADSPWGAASGILVGLFGLAAGVWPQNAKSIEQRRTT